MAGIALSLAAAALLVPQEGTGELTERERAVHALSRLAFGPTPGQVEQVLDRGVDAWIAEQLERGPDDPVVADMLSGSTTLGMTQEELRDVYYVEDRRGVPERELVNAVVVRAMYGGNQTFEVLYDFWRNHFNVSFTKGGVALSQITHWDREVLRANTLGSFPEMLEASAKHPAMLFYLDNHLSRRPPSKQELKQIERRVERETDSELRAEQAVAIASQRGLNENYARELLELHTLGVDKYYEQKDVVAVAEVLTGWTWSGGREGSWGFRFANNLHVEGNKRVLGKVVRGDREDGASEGEKVLEILAKHKGTADFISRKLVRYLVNDEPPESLVRKVAKVYDRSKGDIRAMVEEIVTSDEFWARENYRSKFKTPTEFLISCIRITQAEIEDSAAVLRLLRQMRQPVYRCDDPTGYYDTAEAWLDTGVMAGRWQFALDLAEGKVSGVSIPEAFFDDIPEDLPPRLWQHHLTKKVLPGGAGPRTRAALSSVTNEYLERRRYPDVYELGPQLLGLLLGSPEFQQQ